MTAARLLCVAPITGEEGKFRLFISVCAITLEVRRTAALACLLVSMAASLNPVGWLVVKREIAK